MGYWLNTCLLYKNVILDSLVLLQVTCFIFSYPVDLWLKEFGQFGGKGKGKRWSEAGPLIDDVIATTARNVGNGECG